MSVAYRVWMENNPKIFNEVIQESLEGENNLLSIVIVGCTIQEAVNIVSGIWNNTSKKACPSITLVLPLGTCSDVYGFWCDQSNEKLDQAGLDLALSLSQVGIYAHSVSVFKDDLRNLPNRAFHVLILGPLAFGMLGQRIAFNAGLQSSLIRSLLLKTKDHGGQVWFCVRHTSSWSDAVVNNPSLQPKVNLHFYWENLEGMNMVAFSIGTTMCVDPRIDNLKQALTVSSFDYHGMRLVARQSKLFSETKSTHISETGTLFIVAYNGTAFSDLVSFGFAAESCPVSERNESFIIRKLRDMPLLGDHDGDNVGEDSTRKDNHEFVNTGLRLWEAHREMWTSEENGSGSTPFEPIDYDLVQFNLSRTHNCFELPRPMKLGELIDLFLDIWECNGEE